MEYKTRQHPELSACGLSCGLCPRYHTAGSSKCTGCAGEGFSKVHPACGVLSCCQRRGFEFCYECIAYPCDKYTDADKRDSFITHRNQLSDFARIKQDGFDVFMTELREKIVIIRHLLDNYNDGRHKTIFCTAVALVL